MLYMRSPDGVLFELAAVPAQPAEPVIIETTKEPPPIEQAPPEVKQGRLWVETDPPDAAVTILNLQAEFAQGQELEPGNYHVEVSANGWESQRKWVELKAGEDKHLRITLAKLEAPPPEPAPQPTKIETPPTETSKPAAQTEATPEKEFTNSLGMKFMLIPAGDLSDGEPGRRRGQGMITRCSTRLL